MLDIVNRMSAASVRRNSLVAFAFAAFSGVLLPLQTYVANRSCYSFSVLSLLLETAVAGFVFFVLALVLELATDRLSDGFMAVLLTAVLIFLYLESGPLSFGVPTITGDFPGVLNCVWRKVFDCALTGAVIVVLLVCYRLMRGWIHLVALGVLLLGVASIVDVALTSDGERVPNRGGGFAPFPEIVRQVTYSPVRNVLMFVLDNASGLDAAEVVTRDQGMAGHFPGFVAYRDNIGMHDSTKRGVPALLTGEYFTADRDRTEYVMSAIGPKSFLRLYQDRGWAVCSSLEMLSFGYTTEPVEACGPAAVPSGKLSLLTPSGEVPYLSVADVVLFRVAPFVAKGGILLGKYRQKSDFTDERQKFRYEHFLYPALANRPLSSDGRPLFGKFHSNGAHPPYYFDCNGKPYRDPASVTPAVALSNALVQLSRLLDGYRERGFYDKSLIVVTADHGPRPTGDDGDPTAHALLWVKPEGSRSPLSVSDLPTTHAGISEMLKAAAARSLSRSEIETLLVADHRLFRCVLDDSHFRDYHFDRKPLSERQQNRPAK